MYPGVTRSGCRMAMSIMGAWRSGRCVRGGGQHLSSRCTTLLPSMALNFFSTFIHVPIDGEVGTYRLEL